MLTNLEDIKEEAARFFCDFLQQGALDFQEVSPDFLHDLLAYRCPHERRAHLVSTITGQKIRKALFSFPSGKASGLDGFTKEFYVGAWNIIGADFICAVQSFFIYGFMPRSVNDTLLALIPKNTDASSATMKDYRPIACCNMLYKVI